MNTLVVAAILSLGLAACTHADREKAEQDAKVATGQTMEDFESRKSDMIDKSTTRLNDLEEKIDARSSQANKDKVEDSRELLKDARSELDDAKDADADDFEGERSDFMDKLNELESKVSELG